jgi:hypothetical protein
MKNATACEPFLFAITRFSRSIRNCSRNSWKTKQRFRNWHGIDWNFEFLSFSRSIPVNTNWISALSYLIRNSENWQELVLPCSQKHISSIESYQSDIDFSYELYWVLNALFQSILRILLIQKTRLKFSWNWQELIEKNLKIRNFSQFHVNSGTSVLSFMNSGYSFG